MNTNKATNRRAYRPRFLSHPKKWIGNLENHSFICNCIFIMSLTSDSLKEIIEERLQAPLVQVEDMSGGCGQAFAVIIVSPLFKGKNKLMRHRLVNNSLKEEIAAIHAFTQKGYTPEEWQAQGGAL